MLLILLQSCMQWWSQVRRSGWEKDPELERKLASVLGHSGDTAEWVWSVLHREESLFRLAWVKKERLMRVKMWRSEYSYFTLSLAVFIHETPKRACHPVTHSLSAAYFKRVYHRPLYPIAWPDTVMNRPLKLLQRIMCLWLYTLPHSNFGWAYVRNVVLVKAIMYVRWVFKSRWDYM